MPNRDSRSVRTVGVFVAASGAVLLLFTVLSALLIAFQGGGGGLAGFAHGLLSLVVSFVLASVLLGCGARLIRQPDYTSNPDDLRLNWSALFIVVLAAALLYPLLYWPLTALPVALLVALLAVRPAVIRLTT